MVDLCYLCKKYIYIYIYIFHPFSQATTGQEIECNVDQTVWQARIPVGLKLVAFSMSIKVLNIDIYFINPECVPYTPP